MRNFSAVVNLLSSCVTLSKTCRLVSDALLIA